VSRRAAHLRVALLGWPVAFAAMAAAISRTARSTFVSADLLFAPIPVAVTA
jgi:hypothetical protein